MKPIKFNEANKNLLKPQNMTDEECEREYNGWKEYYSANTHPIFPGMDRIIHRQKDLGGLVCVATLSPKADIMRDYAQHFHMEPDAVYDHDMPRHMRKPNPYPLLDIMQRYDLKPEEILAIESKTQNLIQINDCPLRGVA